MKALPLLFASLAFAACSVQVPTPPSPAPAPAPSASSPAKNDDGVDVTTTKDATKATPTQTIDARFVVMTFMEPVETSSMRAYSATIQAGTALEYEELPALDDISANNTEIVSPAANGCTVTTVEASREDGVLVMITAEEPLSTPAETSPCSAWLQDLETTGLDLMFYDAPYDGTHDKGTVLLQIAPAP